MAPHHNDAVDDFIFFSYNRVAKKDASHAAACVRTRVDSCDPSAPDRINIEQLAS